MNDKEFGGNGMGGTGSGKGKKVERGRKDWFTIRENQFLEVLKRFGKVVDVASEMQISYRRAEKLLANIRRKWEWSVNTHNRLVGMCKRDSAFRKLLSQPSRRTPEIEEEHESS